MRRWLGVLLAALVCLTVAGPIAPAPGDARPAPRAFVSNEFGGDVAIIDVAAGRIVGRVPVGPAGTARPRGLALSPDGKMLFAAVTDASYGQNEAGRRWQFIAAIDIATGRITARYVCGSDPERMALTPDGRRLYCSNEDASGASVLDVATGRVIATVPTGIEPEGVAVSPDGRWVYVTAETSNTITVIDSRTNRAVKNFVVGARPRIVVFSPDGRRAYATAEAGGTLTVIDPALARPVRAIMLGTDSKPVGAAVSPDGRTVYVAGGRCNCIFAVDSATFKVTTVVQRMGRRPWGVAVTADGKKIYTANGRSDDVTVIDAASLRVIGTVAGVGRGPHTVVVSR
jgi:PQQ-dependent catabolism-associated beta-propeller protein